MRPLGLPLALPAALLVSGALAVSVALADDPAGPPAGPSGALPPGSPDTPPSVSGTPRDGETLTANDGSYPTNPGSGSPPQTSRRWLRCQPNDTAPDYYARCTVIPDQTATTYQLTSADIGHSIRVRVRAANTDPVTSTELGSREDDSAPTDTVQAAPPVNTELPAVSGTAQVGETLSGSTGSWTGTEPKSYSYQWQRCSDTCTNVGGATGQTYGVGKGDVGNKLQVVVTASNQAGAAQATSAQTATVENDAPPQQPPPTTTTTGPSNPPTTTQPSSPPASKPPATTPPVIRLLSPFPVVRIAGSFIGRTTRVARLVVSAPNGSTVTVRCRGRGCPYRKASKQVRSGRVRFRGLQRRRLRAGVVLVVTVTKPGSIGKYTRIRIRSGKGPARRDLCLEPGASRPSQCPPES